MKICHCHRCFILTRLEEKKVLLRQQGLLWGDQRTEKWYVLQQKTQRIKYHSPFRWPRMDPQDKSLCLHSF